MKERLLQQTKHEYSPGQRIVTLIIAGALFLVILPGLLIYFAPRLDRALGFPPLDFGAASVIAGGILTAAGFLLGWWANYVQFTVGRGTPVPVMATQQLINQKPYSYCRNPMALGSIVAYLGIAVIMGSICALLLVAAWSGILLTYIKLLEEKEMEVRFGDAYREYRKRTPFIIPRLR